MEFDSEEKVDEGELDALGIKKKDDDLIDVDVDDAAVDSDIIDEDKDKEDQDKGLFGDDPELEEYMLAGYEENY